MEHFIYKETKILKNRRLKLANLKLSGLLLTCFFIATQSFAQDIDEIAPMKYEGNSFHVACYYYDSNSGLDSKNPSLMYPSLNVVTLGANKNYYWALEYDSLFAPQAKLSGKIQDGFFIEENYSYEDIASRCNFAIKQGTLYSSSQPSFRLYEFKASISDLSGYEYPIQFAKKENTNSKIKQIVLFGDSLSDSGNLKRWTKILPYFPFWNGRFSDGMVWGDYFSERTHFPILNFAYGGAKTEGSNDAFLNGLPSSFITAGRNLITGSLKNEINSYLSSYLTSDSYRSINQSISNSQQTLFIIWIGANDYLEKFERNQPADKFFENPDAVGGAYYVYKRAVDNIIEQIENLNKNGAYHFLILNLPDIGKTPAVVTSVYQKYSDDFKNKDEFSKKLTEVIQKHNFYLSSSLKLLQDKLGSRISVNTLDFANHFEKLMNNISIVDGSYFDYGFSKMDSIYPIPGSKGKYLQDFCYRGGLFHAAFTKIGSETILYANQNNICVDANGKRNKLAIFWNSPHPSTYAHCWISYAIEKQLNDSGLILSSMESMESFKKYCMYKFNSY